MNQFINEKEVDDSPRSSNSSSSSSSSDDDDDIKHLVKHLHQPHFTTSATLGVKTNIINSILLHLYENKFLISPKNIVFKRRLENMNQKYQKEEEEV